MVWTYLSLSHFIIFVSFLRSASTKHDFTLNIDTEVEYSLTLRSVVTFGLPVTEVSFMHLKHMSPKSRYVIIFASAVSSLSTSKITTLVVSVPCDVGILQWNTPPFLLPLLFQSQEQCHYLQEGGGSWKHNDCRIANKLLHSIAKQEMWKKIHILYDDSFSSCCLKDIVKRLSFGSVASQLIHVGIDESIRSVVQYISNTNSRNILYVVAEELTIRSMLQEANPYIKKSTDPESGKVVFFGLCYDILEDLSKALNFRYHIKNSVDGLFGNPNEDSSNATGMIGMAMRGEADLAIGPITRTAARLKVVDFLTPFQEEGIGFLMKKIDSPLLEQMFHVFRPISLVCWVAVVVSTVLTGIILTILAKLSPSAEHKEASLSRNLWIALSSILGQEDCPRPTFHQGYIILGFWWIFITLIMALYASSLAAFLTVPLPNAPLRNLEELASQTHYKPLVTQGTNLFHLFKSAKGGLHKRIWEMMSDMPKITVMDEAFSLVETGKYAFISDSSELRFELRNKCDELEIAQDSFLLTQLSFVVQKKFPFKDAFDNHIMKMEESGIITKLRRKYWSQAHCYHSRVTGGTELKIKNMGGLFIVYLVFIFLSLISIVAEVMILRRSCMHKRKIEYKEKKDDEMVKDNDEDTNL